MKEERDLIAAFGKAADGYDREKVIGAAANMLLNALRQSHPRLGGASEELRDLAARMQAALERSHYHADGTRNDRRMVLPQAGRLFPSLAGREHELLDRFLTGAPIR